MKKLVLTLALVFGVLAANAQYFVGGQLGLLYDDASENTMITIAPEFGYAFNDTWTVAGMIGYTHMGRIRIRVLKLVLSRVYLLI